MEYLICPTNKSYVKVCCMIPEFKKRISVRLSSKQLEKINFLISKEKYQNLSTIVREALKQFLEEEMKNDG